MLVVILRLLKSSCNEPTEDGEWKMKVLGLSIGGSYAYDPEQQ